MKKVTGIGGIFFKCKDSKKTMEWYSKNLGFKTDEYGSSFMWNKIGEPEKKGFTLWAPFKESTDYFKPSGKEFMINFRVENLDELVKSLKSDGVKFLDEIETFEYGKFVHLLDPDGVKIELWEPNDEKYEKFIGENKMF
jgi:predicted enzyme related to lactoylglutathione lyase